MKKSLYGLMLLVSGYQLVIAQEIQSDMQELQSEDAPVAQPAQDEAKGQSKAAEEVVEAPAAKVEQPVASQDNTHVNIGLDLQSRTKVAQALKGLLADEYVLYTKTLKYHWNVQGEHFGPLHELFGKQYAMLLEFIDSIAERIRVFGFMAPGTFAEFSQLAKLQENAGSNPNDRQMIADLLADHEQVIRSVRKCIDLTAELNDMGTNNFLGDLIAKHEKAAWMLRAHLMK